LILEEYEHARKRGAKIYAEVVGGGMSADAYHLTATHPEGLGAELSMRWALEEAGLKPADVDYLNPHATSTPLGDVSEMKAIVKLFGEKPDHLHISATKSAIGHLLGAAGAAEALICIKSIQDNVIPPTVNTVTIDPAMPQNFNIVLGKKLNKTVNVALSNTFGFGGHNASAVFKRYTD
jgi:3-oxoacyl-[acyl-carrier-protein] synthase II